MELGAKYILSVFRNKGFSAAARELGIAQPSLSATVAKFEKELGFKVFNRGTNPLSLTEEGQIYINHLNEVIESEQNMRYRIAHSAPSFTSALRIGVSPTSYGCQQLVIKAISIFNERHPHTSIQLNMGQHTNNEELYKRLRRKNFDLIVSENCKTDSGISCIHLTDDHIVFAVRKDLPEAASVLPYSLTRKEALMTNALEHDFDSTLLSGLPFITAGSENTTVKKLSETIGDNYTLSKISVSNHYQTHYQLMCEGLGAAITSTKQLFNHYFEDEDIVYFIPKTDEPYQKCYIKRICDKTPHKHENEFIEILRDISKNPADYI